MDVGTLKNVVLFLLGLSVIWIIRVLVKRELENLLRAALVSLLLGAIFFYLQNTKLETITWAGIKDQIKQTFFPERPPNYVYYQEEGYAGKTRYIRYSFESPGPRLSLTLDSEQKYFHLKDVDSVNRILEYVGLPKIKKAVPELASLTGSRNDLNLYRWDEYPKGILVVERGICQDRDRLESYQCIVNITIFQK